MNDLKIVLFCIYININIYFNKLVKSILFFIYNIFPDYLFVIFKIYFNNGFILLEKNEVDENQLNSYLIDVLQIISIKMINTKNDKYELITNKFLLIYLLNEVISTKMLKKLFSYYEDYNILVLIYSKNMKLENKIINLTNNLELISNKKVKHSIIKF